MNGMKIAAWNVNSLRARFDHLLRWLELAAPDVALLQETKVTDDKFPRAEIVAAGYECAYYGQSAYNGVAILSRLPMTDVARGMAQRADDEQARLIAATIGGARVASVYVPNGGEVGSDKYAYKLAWLADFADYVGGLAGGDAVIGGDYNIAPADSDVYDIDDWGVGNIQVSAPERAALAEVLGRGYCDAHTMFEHKAGTFTRWDYRGGAFARNRGLRIDLMLLSRSVTPRCVYCVPDMTPRRWERPSDHTPVIAEFV